MTLTIWLAFFCFIAILVAIDVGVTRRRPRSASPAESLLTTALYALAAVAVAYLLAQAYATRFMGFGEIGPGGIGRAHKPGEVWSQFLTAYVVEIALSIDNVAIFALVFEYFGVRPAQRHRALFWAIIACLIVRAGFIAIVGEVLHQWWMIYVFGTLIALAMVRTLVMPDESDTLENRWAIRVLAGLSRRFARSGPGRAPGPADAPGTPAATSHAIEDPGAGPGARPGAALGLDTGISTAIVILATIGADISFAADSIPAVYSVTNDPVIALASNAMAVLTVRSVYFSLANVVGKFRYLKVAVVLLLLALAIKMYLARTEKAYHLAPTLFTLGAALTIFGVAGLASYISVRRRMPAPAHRPTPLADLTEAAAASRRNLRKIAILIAGTIVILVGIMIAPLPGPGPLILVPIGLGILATEFIWAKRLLDRFKAQTAAMQQRAEKLSKRTPLWLVPVVVLSYAGAVAVIVHLLHVAAWKVIAPATGLFIPIGYWAVRAVVLHYKSKRSA